MRRVNRYRRRRAAVSALAVASVLLIGACGGVERSNDAGPPGTSISCPSNSSVAPLDDDCTSGVCYAALRFGYQNLQILGYTTGSAAASPVDATGAQEVARAVFDANGQYLSPDIQVQPRQAGVFVASVAPSDFGAMALVSADSGAVIVAGAVEWSGRGEYWAPPVWKDSSQIGCLAKTTPAEAVTVPGSCNDYPNATTPKSADDATSVALQTNLASLFTARGPFSVFTYLYTPTVGACDPSVAEYVVVLTQRR